MKKLNKRQIVILVIAGLFVLYAVYDLFLAKNLTKNAKVERDSMPVETFIQAMSGELMKQKVSGVEAHISQIAEKDWSKNPFWGKDSYREFRKKAEKPGLTPKIVYSGYIDAGGKKLAIINGWEYEPGESLEIEGFVLKKVAPSRVVITNRNTGGDLIVPIQE